MFCSIPSVHTLVRLWFLGTINTWLPKKSVRGENVWPMTKAVKKYHTVGFRSNRHPSVTVTRLTKFWFRHLAWRAVTSANFHQVWQRFEPFHQYL